jgi:hypothetical protein
MWISGSLHDVIFRIYETSPSPNSALRLLAVSQTCKHINQTPNKAQIRALLAETPDFSADVALHLASQMESFSLTLSAQMDALINADLLNTTAVQAVRAEMGDLNQAV